MKGPALVVVLFAVFALTNVAGHGNLVEPPCRLGDREVAQTKKYTHASYGTDGDYPLGSTILRTCGDEDGEPATEPDGVTPQNPMYVYTPGATINVVWRLTAPHPVSPSSPREMVRISVAEQEDEDDTTYDFNEEENIIYEATVPPETDVSGSENAAADDTMTVQVTLPDDAEGNHYVLQWVWDSEADGGGYIDCADIAIRTPLTITLTFKLHYTDDEELTQQDVENFVENYFGTWNALNSQVTLEETSTDHYDVTVMLTDYDGVPAENLLAAFYAMYEDEDDREAFENNFGGTISAAADDSPLGGADDDITNPFTGAASALVAGPMAVVLAAVALLFLH